MQFPQIQSREQVANLPSLSEASKIGYDYINFNFSPNANRLQKMPALKQTANAILADLGENPLECLKGFGLSDEAAQEVLTALETVSTSLLKNRVKAINSYCWTLTCFLKYSLDIARFNNGTLPIAY